ERTGWDPASIDAVAYAFFDGAGEAALMWEAFDKDGRAHGSGCTAPSLRRLRAVSSNGYVVDRTQSIPGLSTEESEFMPRKGLVKRSIYGWTARWPWLDWQVHRRSFKRWVRGSAAEHQQYTEELSAGLAEYGLEKKLRPLPHHDTHAAHTVFPPGLAPGALGKVDGDGAVGGGGE